MADFESTVTVNRPVEQVFEFLLRPANVVKISPPSVGLQFTSAPDVIEVGSRLEFKMQAYGQVLSFLHEITLIDRPHKIVEKQAKGMFQKWVHEHVLESTPNGQTVIVDRIDFVPPGGLLGLLMTKVRIIEQLDDAYFHRNKQLKKLLEAASHA